MFWLSTLASSAAIASSTGKRLPETPRADETCFFNLRACAATYSDPTQRDFRVVLIYPPAGSHWIPFETFGPWIDARVFEKKTCEAPKSDLLAILQKLGSKWEADMGLGLEA